jgi:hypothetical protein
MKVLIYPINSLFFSFCPHHDMNVLNQLNVLLFLLTEKDRLTTHHRKKNEAKISGSLHALSICVRIFDANMRKNKRG